MHEISHKNIIAASDTALLGTIGAFIEISLFLQFYPNFVPGKHDFYPNFVTL